MRLESGFCSETINTQYTIRAIYSLQSWPKNLETPSKNMRKIVSLRKTPRKSMLLCLYDIALVTTCPPLLPQTMLKTPPMILDVKGASKQHRRIRGGKGMRGFEGRGGGVAKLSQDFLARTVVSYFSCMHRASLLLAGISVSVCRNTAQYKSLVLIQR